MTIQMDPTNLVPVTPPLTVRALHEDELAQVCEPLNTQLLQTEYSLRLHAETAATHLLSPNPPTLYPVRWQHHQCFCAWRAGLFHGLIDVGIGLDSESLDLPDYAPLGLLRFLLLPTTNDHLEQVTIALFEQAESYWQQHRVGRVKAFHKSTGYPLFRAGLGALPGDWHKHIRLLTEANYQLMDRFYAMLRPLEHPLEEPLPSGKLSLTLRGKATDRHYQLYSRVDHIGEARIVELRLPTEQRTTRIANLVTLHVHSEWRGQDIGKWLLCRVINDATLQGYHQMLVHVPHRAFIMQNLLTQHGFQEQNYRGYSLEKTLTR